MSKASRRTFISRATRFGLASVVIAASANCSAPTTSVTASPRVRRIGYLSNANATSDPREATPSLSRSLRELGYKEGEDLVIEKRFSEGDRHRLAGLAAELVSLPVDVIVTTGGVHTALAVKAATTKIPVVFTGLADPIGFGIVPSLARPGGNLTGVVNPDIYAKRVELLKETVPTLSRVVVLFNEADAGGAAALESVQGATSALRITSIPVAINAPADLDEALGVMSRHQPDGIVDTHGQMFYGRELASFGKVLDFAIAHRLPQTFNGLVFARAGGLMALGENTDARWRGVARLVDRILGGAYPGDLPVQVVDAVDLVVNLGTARKIGLSIPDSILRRATEIVS